MCGPQTEIAVWLAVLGLMLGGIVADETQSETEISRIIRKQTHVLLFLSPDEYTEPSLYVCNLACFSAGFSEMVNSQYHQLEDACCQVASDHDQAVINRLAASATNQGNSGEDDAIEPTDDDSETGPDAVKRSGRHWDLLLRLLPGVVNERTANHRRSAASATDEVFLTSDGTTGFRWQPMLGDSSRAEPALGKRRQKLLGSRPSMKFRMYH